MSEKKMTILGAGNGGKAFAGDMAYKGWEVTLYEVPEFAGGLKEIMETKQINILDRGEKHVGILKEVTTDIEKALAANDLIFIIMPGFGHKRIAELCAPYLREGQIFVFMPGGFGSFEFYQHLKGMGAWKPVTLAETATLPYGTNATGPCDVMIHVHTAINPFGVFPATKFQEVYDLVKDCDPTLEPAVNILDVAMNNLNPSGHVVPCLLAVTQMEGNPDYHMYRDADTPSVKKLILKIDAERIAARKALGFGEPHHPFQPGQEMEQPYFGDGSLYMPGRKKIPGPFSIKHRYVTEDAPYGFVFFATMAKKAGVETPAMDTTVNLAGLLNDANYWETGRSVKNLGLEDMPLEKLMDLLNNGE